MNFGKNAQDTWLKSAGFEMDQMGKFDELPKTNSSLSRNTGFMFRKELFQDPGADEGTWEYHG